MLAIHNTWKAILRILEAANAFAKLSKCQQFTTTVGIQIADYISGAFSSILKASIDNDYSRGIKMFYESVYPNLRRDLYGKIQGYGIREVPKSEQTRRWLIVQMNNFKPKTG